MFRTMALRFFLGSRKTVDCGKIRVVNRGFANGPLAVPVGGLAVLRSHENHMHCGDTTCSMHYRRTKVPYYVFSSAKFGKWAPASNGGLHTSDGGQDGDWEWDGKLIVPSESCSRVPTLFSLPVERHSLARRVERLDRPRKQASA